MSELTAAVDQPSVVDMERQLEEMEDRLSVPGVTLMKDYSKGVRSSCGKLFKEGKVNDCIGIWQQAQKVIFFTANGTKQLELQYDDELVIFLQESAEFFSKLQSPDENMNVFLFKKRIELYGLIFGLLEIADEDSISPAIKQSISGLHRLCGLCHFRLKDMESAFVELSENANILKDLPWSVPDAEWSESDTAACFNYCEARLEAIECLKVQKKYPEAMSEYLEVLALCERLNEGSASVSMVKMLGGVCNNVAMCCYHTFQYEKSLPYFERTLVAWEEVYGPDVPAVDQTRQNLATNRKLAAFTAEQEAKGANITKMDLTNPRPLDQQEEKDKYFTKDDSK